MRVRGRVIVVEPDQPKAMRAGEALQTYIEKMSGARLGLVEEGAAMPDGIPVRLLVGHTAAAGGLGVTIPAGFDQTIRPDIFEEEGYVLKTVGQDIVVAGNNDSPTFSLEDRCHSKTVTCQPLRATMVAAALPSDPLTMTITSTLRSVSESESFIAT